MSCPPVDVARKLPMLRSREEEKYPAERLVRFITHPIELKDILGSTFYSVKKSPVNGKLVWESETPN